MLFVGTVVDPGVPSAKGTEAEHDVHMRVDEIFEGLPKNTNEVTVAIQGSWLERGHSYLIDAGRSEDGRLYPAICGASGDIAAEWTTDVLDFLRRRAKGETKTLLTVSVTDNYKPVADVDVTITGPQGSLTNRTASDGTAAFSGIKPSTYSISVAREHYSIDTESLVDREVSVIAGACASAQVSVKAEASVSGVVRDIKGSPVPSLELELVTKPEHPPGQNIFEQAVLLGAY